MRVYAEWLDRSFDAERSGGTWNGFEVPLFTADQAREVVAAHPPATPSEWGISHLEWDGDVIVMTDPTVVEGGVEWTERVEADADGLYCLGFGWVWTEEDSRV